MHLKRIILTYAALTNFVIARDLDRESACASAAKSLAELATHRRFLDLPSSLIENPDTQPWDSFVIPNEKNPEDAKELLRNAPPGVIIAPGTERLYFDYLLAPNSTHLLGVDIDENITQFHKINSILFRIVPDGAKIRYRRARMDPSLDRWRVRAQWALENNRISEADFRLLIQDETLNWWKTQVATPIEWIDFHNVDRSPFRSYANVNYLYNRAAFKRLQKLMLSGNFQTVKLDLGNRSQIDVVVAALQKAGIPLSVLDLSNAWGQEFPNDYLGYWKTGSLIESLNTIAHPESILLGTWGTSRGSQGLLRQIYTRYAGMNFATVRKLAALHGSSPGVRDPFVGAAKELANQLLRPSQAPPDENGKRFIRINP